MMDDEKQQQRLVSDIDPAMNKPTRESLVMDQPQDDPRLGSQLEQFGHTQSAVTEEINSERGAPRMKADLSTSL